MSLRTWIVVGAIAVAASVVIAWLTESWLGVLPLVAVVPLWWRGGDRG